MDDVGEAGQEAVEVDQDAVLWARTTLLGSGRPSLVHEVEAYRVLSAVSPSAYRSKLAQALLSYAYVPEVRDLPDVLLARLADAAAAARRIGADDPKRTEVLVRALSAYRSQLYAAGRRAEAFAVCEEMAEAGRWGFAHRQVPSPAYGHGPLATALAEDGRHQEAAELCGLMARSGRAADSAEFSFWAMVAWAAELDAAGRHDAALAVFAEMVDTQRAHLDANGCPLAVLTWQLVHQASMLDAAGHRAGARTARQEALALLSELDATGERKDWSNILAWWTTLLALSGRSAEPVPRPGAPEPAFGSDPVTWSPDVRQEYFDGLSALEEQAAAAKEAARSDPLGRLLECVVLHRRLVIRSALYQETRGHRILKPLRPLFDEAVALARRLADLSGTEQSRQTLGRALTDRSMFLVAAKQYGEAFDGFLDVVDLLD